MSTLIQRLEARLSVSPMSDFDRETISQALELARAEQYRVDHEAEKVKNLEGAREQALAQMSSISGMVAALTCDYDRLEELREEKRPFTAGWNMAGYMPDSTPEGYESFDDAREAIVDELVQMADGVDETLENAAEIITKFEEAQNYVKSQSGEFSFQCGAWVYWVTESNNFGLSDDDYQELVDLEESAGDCESEDDARERIHEDALDFSVRSEWQNIGETLEPSEFMVLLCTGGPACRIVGELDQYKQPCRAWIEYQDWFTPWTELVDGVSHSDLLTYCQQFYFGE